MKEIKLTNETIKVMEEMIGVQGANGNWNCDPYMHGMLNGMIYIYSMVKNKEPSFREAPKRWLDKHENFFRFQYRYFIRPLSRLYRKIRPHKISCESVENK